MKADLQIKNARIIDTARGINRIGDIAVKGRRIIDGTEDIQAEHVIDAADCIVTPGLIDFHAHINDKATDCGTAPDLISIPYGVTAIVDGGSAGVSTYRSLLERLTQSYIKSKLYLHVSAGGLTTRQFPECIMPEIWEKERFAEAFEYYGDKILGFKIRASKKHLQDRGMEGFYATVELAKEFNKSLVVHVSNPPAQQSEIASALKKGDIFCHVYDNTGNNILDNGVVMPEIWEARKRGVLFDMAHGMFNLDFNIAEQALAQGFKPDIISTDISSRSWCWPPVYNLPHVMSKHLALGLDLEEIIACVTSTPAAIMGMSGQIGTLAPGASADIAIFKLVEKAVTFTDSSGAKRDGNLLLMPLATIIDGKLVYRSMDLCLE